VVRKKVSILAEGSYSGAVVLPRQGYQDYCSLDQVSALRRSSDVDSGHRQTVKIVMMREWSCNFTTCIGSLFITSRLSERYPVFLFPLSSQVQFATHHTLVVVNPRETRYDRLACLGEVRSRLGLLPRLLERGEFC
jgi:hypothetical protein